MQNKLVSFLKSFDFLLIAAAFISLVPFIGHFMLVDMIIFIIFVMAYDLVYGFMGKLSFGHMLFLGTGAYAAVIFSNMVSPNPLLAILFAILAGAVVGSLIGFIVVKTSGAVFALVNFAFNNLGSFAAVTGLAFITGGQDGLSGSFSVIGPLNLYKPNVKFWFMLVVMLLVFLFVKKLTGSAFGTLLKSIKEDETRPKFLGYNIFGFEWLNFTISAALSALAGSLWAINIIYVNPSAIDPLRNVEVIFAALIGGAGSPYGAIIGGAIFHAISNYLAMYITRWEMFLGIVLLIIVFRFPTGVRGFMKEKVLQLSFIKRLTEGKSQ